VNPPVIFERRRIPNMFENGPTTVTGTAFKTVIDVLKNL
jgi:hypothetical protein